MVASSLRPCHHCHLKFCFQKGVATHEATCLVTKLYDAASRGDEITVASLLRKGVDCDAIFEMEKGCTENALKVAIKRGYVGVIQILVKAGAFLDMRTTDLRTPRQLLDANIKTRSVIKQCAPRKSW